MRQLNLNAITTEPHNLEPVLPNKRSHCNEKLTQAIAHNEDPKQPKKKKKNLNAFQNTLGADKFCLNSIYARYLEHSNS